jgi:hypothetical protein
MQTPTEDVKQAPVGPPVPVEPSSLPTTMGPPSSPVPPPHWLEHFCPSQVTCAWMSVWQSALGVQARTQLVSLHAHAAMQLTYVEQVPPLTFPEAYPEPKAFESSAPQFDSVHEVHAWSDALFIGLLSAHAKCVGEPPPLELLHAIAEAAQASASAVKPRNPIMKEPPE